MPWEARTAFIEIKPGTRLCMYESPQIGGQPAPVLRGSQPIKIEVNDRWIDAQVIDATRERAILQLPEGQRFEITPRKHGEFDSGITLRGMHFQDWIVRSELEPEAE